MLQFINKNMRYKKIFHLFILIICSLFLTACQTNKNTKPENSNIKINTSKQNNQELNMNQNSQQLSKPTMTIDPQQKYTAVIKTNFGDITVELFADLSPVTVNNFVYLAQKHFYDNTIFHRVIKDFMIQGGDPEGSGRGGPGYTFEDEFNDQKLVQGSLAMANAGPNTNGSQFFIVTKDSTPWLDGKHTNFGKVIDGMDVVIKIQAVATDENDRPTEKILIQSIEVKNE